MAASKGQPAPKPSQLPASPAKQQSSAVDDFFAGFDAPEVTSPIPGAPGDEAYASLDVQEAEQTAGVLNNVTSAGNSALMTGVDVAGRVLDYPGGIARAGLAEAAGLAAGKGSIVTGEDLKNAAVGKGPSAEEYLKRLGVGEGGSFTTSKFGKFTTRGAAGLALDIGTDPLTAVAKLIKSVPYIKKIIQLPGSASEALGEAAYRSALRPVDEKLAEKGAGKLSDIMLEEGAPVGMEAVAKKADDLKAVMGKMRQGLYERATEKGVTIDTAFPLKNAEAVLARMQRDPGLRPAADDLRGLLDRYKSAGKVGIDQLSEWKTNLYDSLPANAFDGHGKLKGIAKQFKAALAGDFRQAIIEAGNKAEKGLGDSINAINEKWGTLIQAEGPLVKGARSSNKIGAIIDGAVLGGAGVPAYASKKAYELAFSPAAKMAVSKALRNAGTKETLNRLTRQSIAEVNRPIVISPEEEADAND